jgi:signal transduction histidine kinase
MTAILEQLLLLARLESSSQENQTQRVPLTTLVDETISHHKTQISTKNLHVEVENKLEDQALVPYFYGKIILDNVLNNAVKYAYENSKIGIQLRSENGKVRCTVSDHGVGIKSEDLEKIYDHFYRSDALNHKHISGNGLGLAIVKKCADAIQAEVQVESTLGNGTTFTLFFTEE